MLVVSVAGVPSTASPQAPVNRPASTPSDSPPSQQVLPCGCKKPVHHARTAPVQPASSQTINIVLGQCESFSNDCAKVSKSKPELPWNVGEEIIKALAEGGLALVSLSFAAFTFLYASMLSIRERDERANELRTKLRGSLYATGFTVVLSSGMTISAFSAMYWGGRVLTSVTIALPLIIVLVISGIAVYLAIDVYQEGQPQSSNAR